MIKKIMLAAAIMSLSAAPAWALGPGHAESSGRGSTRSQEAREQAEEHRTIGEENRSTAEASGKAGEEHRTIAGERSKTGEEHRMAKGEKGMSHRCRPHAVAYVAAGTLVSDSLTEGEHRTVSGELTVEVKRANHHAKADKGTTKTYTLEGSRLRGPLNASAIAEGDFVKLLGRITVIAPKCEAGEFTPTLKIRQVVVHAPHHS